MTAPWRAFPAQRVIASARPTANSLETTVYIAPEALGQGAGRALLGVLVERCAGPGYRRIIGVIGDSDNTASIKLYEAVGFRQAGLLRSVGYKHGRWLGSVFMQRDLGHGDPAPPDRI